MVIGRFFFKLVFFKYDSPIFYFFYRFVIFIKIDNLFLGYKLSQISSILNMLPLLLLISVKYSSALVNNVALIQCGFCQTIYLFYFFGLPFGFSTSVKHFPVYKPEYN